MKIVWTTLRYSIATIVHNEPLGLRNVVGCVGGWLACRLIRILQSAHSTYSGGHVVGSVGRTVSGVHMVGSVGRRWLTVGVTRITVMKNRAPRRPASFHQYISANKDIIRLHQHLTLD